jgi:hypothetical protein
VENFIVTGKKMQTAKENGETILTQKKCRAINSNNQEKHVLVA